MPMPTLAKLTAVIALALLTALASTQAFVPSANAAFTDTDADGAIDLAEEVFGSDPNDAASTPETSSFLLHFAPEASCVDGLDNDGDGATDATDSGCIDSDGDSSLPDDLELRLGSDPEDFESSPEDSRLDAINASNNYPFAACRDGNDDDLDGFVDAADTGCPAIDGDADGFEEHMEKALGSDWEDAGSVPEHVSINPGSCTDAVDNDGDALTDAADNGCLVAPNDDFADAIIIDSLPFAHTAKAGNTTVELGERVSDCSGFNGSDGLRGTVWYEYTPPAATHVIVDAAGSDLLSTVSVWRLGDAFGLAEVDCATAVPFFGAAPRFAFEAVAGETHYIQVERFLSFPDEPDSAFLDLGRLSFQMEVTTPPPNDNFASATQINSLPFESSVDTVAASVQGFEPDASCAYNQGYTANSVWYRYAPVVDTYLKASAFPGTDFGAKVGAFEGTSLASLTQVACGREALAFHARAGQTYYLQAAGYTCQSPSEGGEVASFCIDSRGGDLELRVESFDLPTCPTPQFTFDDPLGDTDNDNFPIDIRSVSFASNGQHACITARLDRSLPPFEVHAWLEVDADLNRATGSRGDTDASSIYTSCDYPTGLGFEYRAFADGADQGLLINWGGIGDTNSQSPDSPYFIYEGTLGTFIVPLSRMGGDADVGFAIELYSHDTNDCAPNGGHIACSGGACAFVPFRNGDANCVPGANAIDAAIVLQHSAGLLATLPCPDAADVDGNDVIDSRDAALILQYSAGLLDQLPPIPCRKPPEFC